MRRVSSELKAKLEKMHEIPREQRNVARGKTQQGTVGLLSLVSRPGDAEMGSREGFFGK